MRILALQLKRIGDLVLTTPALAAIHGALPDATVTLGVQASTAGLLPVIPHHAEAMVFGPGRGWTPWHQVLTGRFDAVLDFTGTDRSAMAAVLSRAPRRITFSWVRKKRVRALAFNEFIESAVRERHTIDHYLDLLRALEIEAVDPNPRLDFPEIADPSPSTVILHPGTARPDKNWLPKRWGEVARHIATKHRIPCVVTAGPDPDERAAAGMIGVPVIVPSDLRAFAALISRALLVVSCDTATVHLAAAFSRPQVALFGPTNPFHWRPRHPRAVVLSAAQPDRPMTDFDPRLKGRSMEHISTALVCRAIDDLLSRAS
ncbi:MAG: glycosyltransferase family 9 protein [Chthoniobacteraceae bacterium]